MSTVVIVRLQHQAIAVLNYELRQIDLFTKIICLFGPHSPGPGNVRSNRGALGITEEPSVPIGCQDSEDCFLMNQLGAEAVNHADRPGAICIQQRGVSLNDGQIFINEQTFVDDIDVGATCSQTPLSELELIWRTNECGIALALKELLEQLKFFLCRQSFQVNNGDARLMVWLSSQKLFV